MNANRVRFILLTAVIGPAVVPTTVYAANMLTFVDAQFDTYFGAQSDSYRASDPANLPSWPAIGPGPYSGTAVPGIPGPPGGIYGSPYPYPSTVYGGSFFDSDFANGDAIVGAIGTPVPPPSVNSLFYVFMQLQALSGGYAYEQINFTFDYQVAPGDSLPSGFTAPFIFASADFAGSDGYAQFGGEVTYWDGSTGEQLGPSLTYIGTEFTSTNQGEAFAEGVTLNAVPGGDIFRIAGDFFLTSDDAYASALTPTTPEPSSISLLAAGLVCIALAVMRRRESWVPRVSIIRTSR